MVNLSNIQNNFTFSPLFSNQLAISTPLTYTKKIEILRDLKFSLPTTKTTYITYALLSLLTWIKCSHSHRVQPFHLCLWTSYLLSFPWNLYASLFSIFSFSPTRSVASAYKPPLISPVTELIFPHINCPIFWFLKELPIWLLHFLYQYLFLNLLQLVFFLLLSIVIENTKVKVRSTEKFVLLNLIDTCLLFPYLTNSIQYFPPVSNISISFPQNIHQWCPVTKFFFIPFLFFTII